MTQDIELMVNPERHFSHSKKIKELKGKKFNEILDIFKERIENWYIHVGETLLKQKDFIIYQFSLMTVSVMLIDLLSQYEFNKKNSSRQAYQNFLKKHIPEFQMSYEIDPIRQEIADSWPNIMDDSAARNEWNWKPEYNLEKMTTDMLWVLSQKLLKY